MEYYTPEQLRNMNRTKRNKIINLIPHEETITIIPERIYIKKGG